MSIIPRKRARPGPTPRPIGAHRGAWLALFLMVLSAGCDRTPVVPGIEQDPASSTPDAATSQETHSSPNVSEPLAGPPTFAGFREVAARAGLTDPQLSGDDPPQTILDVKSTGAALLDIDGDGLLDVFLTSGSTLDRWRAGEPGFPCRLYRNLGGLRFEEWPDRAGLPEFRWASGAAAADLDGDGDDDLVVTGVGRDRIFRNDAGRLVEIEECGLGAAGWSTSAAIADLDGDGTLDLYVVRYLDFDFEDPPVHGDRWSCQWENRVVICGPRGLPASRDAVYAGNGDGTFHDVTEEWGFGEATPGYGLAVVVADFTGDAAPEIFVANDSSPNFLWLRKDGRWVDRGFRAGLSVDVDGQEQAGMGADVGDVDGDGRLDLVVTNFERESENLYLAAGGGSFFDRAEAWGLGVPSRPTLSWGIGLEDFDADGDLDLFVANGHVYPQADEVPTSPGYAQRDQLYLQGTTESGRKRFTERGSELGITEKTVSRGALFGDLDNDGDVDILVSHRGAPPALYENRGTPGHRGWTITLAQPGTKNRQAIGARITFEAGEFRRIDEVRRQSSFQSSGDHRVFIGVGQNRADGATVQVRWPDGEEETFELPESGGAVTLTRGQG